MWALLRLQCVHPARPQLQCASSSSSSSVPAHTDTHPTDCKQSVYLLLLLALGGAGGALVFYGFAANKDLTSAFNEIPTDLDNISGWLDDVCAF